MKKLIALGVMASLAATVYGETVVLQKGLDSYTGVKDLTIFDDLKAEAYTWYNSGNQKGTPTDAHLVNCAFKC